MGQRGSFHLGRIAGIDLYLHWTWFLVFLLEFQDRGRAYSSPLWNVLEIVALFAIVTLHEYGHALACRKVGGHAERILLWPFGGIAYVDPPVRPGATLWTLAAGPLVNVALVPILYVAMHAAVAPAMALSSLNLYLFVRTVFYINLVLLLFNLLPIYPLDGGQILRSLLWYPLGRARSLWVASIIGFIGVAGLLFVSWRTGDLWLGAITLFILVYCWKGLRSAQTLWKLSQLHRHEGVACPWCLAPAPAAPLWRCAGCHEAFDLFSCGAACPACHTPTPRVPCPMCGHVNLATAWLTAAIAQTG
ncbi:MAG: site-2 protease family protein [Terriglobales bacterium]